jgi:crotonobetainyl-CoA:carnitine CoA-transferase CaiB-like acyl-CoA transferase
MTLDVAVPGDNAPVRQLGLPFRLSDSPAVPPRPAGPAGADSQAILAELGFGEAEWHALEADGAFDGEERR